MLKLGKIIREKKCKIIQKSTNKNTNFKISLGGVHFSNALICNRDSINFKDYNDESMREYSFEL